MKSLNVLSILTVLVLVIARYSSLADLEAPVPAPVSASYAEAVAPSPVPQELALPESPETTCVGAVFHEATSEAPSCSDTMYNYKDPELSCCEALAKYYGMDSAKPSRNCFCYEPYWARLQELEEVTYIGLMAYLDFCSASNLTIAYYQDGEGPCAGLPPAEEESSSSSSASMTGRTLGQWIRDLHGEGLMTLSFTLGLISAVGFVAMLWPLAMDTVLQICKSRDKKTA